MYVGQKNQSNLSYTTTVQYIIVSSTFIDFYLSPEHCLQGIFETKTHSQDRKMSNKNLEIPFIKVMYGVPEAFFSLL